MDLNLESRQTNELEYFIKQIGEVPLHLPLDFLMSIMSTSQFCYQCIYFEIMLKVVYRFSPTLLLRNSGLRFSYCSIWMDRNECRSCSCNINNGR